MDFFDEIYRSLKRAFQYLHSKTFRVIAGVINCHETRRINTSLDTSDSGDSLIFPVRWAESMEKKKEEKKALYETKS